MRIEVSSACRIGEASNCSVASCSHSAKASCRRQIQASRVASAMLCPMPFMVCATRRTTICKHGLRPRSLHFRHLRADDVSSATTDVGQTGTTRTARSGNSAGWSSSTPSVVSQRHQHPGGPLPAGSRRRYPAGIIGLKFGPAETIRGTDGRLPIRRGIAGDHHRAAQTLEQLQQRRMIDKTVTALRLADASIPRPAVP